MSKHVNTKQPSDTSFFYAFCSTDPHPLRPTPPTPPHLCSSNAVPMSRAGEHYVSRAKCLQSRPTRSVPFNCPPRRGLLYVITINVLATRSHLTTSLFSRLSYVRYLEHSNTVAAISISRTTGDIATVSHTSKY